jgi:hypothetical protein
MLFAWLSIKTMVIIHITCVRAEDPKTFRKYAKMGRSEITKMMVRNSPKKTL